MFMIKSLGFFTKLYKKRLYQNKRITVLECPFQTEYTLFDTSKKYFVKNILRKEFKNIFFQL